MVTYENYIYYSMRHVHVPTCVHIQMALYFCQWDAHVLEWGTKNESKIIMPAAIILEIPISHTHRPPYL